MFATKRYEAVTMRRITDKIEYSATAIYFHFRDKAGQGNPEEDAYAFVRGIIADCIEASRFRSDLKDVDLIAQTVWAGVHGVISLQIAKCNDDWVDWKPMKKRAAFMVETLIDGM